MTTEKEAIDTQDLLCLADVLITDYSSCYFDYLLLSRPIILFAYDLHSYVAERGLYYPLDDLAMGPLATDVSGLASELDDSLADPNRYASRLCSLRNQYQAHRNGGSAARVTAAIRECLGRGREHGTALPA